MFKIAFIITDLSKIGGVERVITTLANNLSFYNNLEVNIISIFGNDISKVSFKTYNNVKIILFNNENVKEKNPIKIIKKNINLINKINDLNLDLIITCNSIYSLKFAILKKFCKFKIVASQHAEYNYDNKKINFLKRIFYKKLDGIHVLTNKDKENYLNLNKNIFKISNPSSYKSKYKYSVKSKNITFIGRLSKEKSVEYLIKAFSLSKYKEKYNLVIIGEGPEEKKLKELAKELKCEKNISFFKFSTNLEKFYSNTISIVLTSQSESFGMVIIEGMSFGVPTISFNKLVGPESIINNGINGILVEKNNVFKLRDSIDCLIENEKFRIKLSENSFEMSKKYDEKIIAEKWYKKLNEILDEKEVDKFD